MQQPITRVTNIKIDPTLSLNDDIDNSDTEALKDILPTDLLDNDLVSRIMNEDDELTKNSSTFDDITDDRELSNLERKDELADILSPHFNLEFKMDGKDVEEIFKGVLTDESQESQEQITQSLNKPVMNNGMSQMDMTSNMNMVSVSSTNTSIQGHQMLQQQQQMQSPLISHSPMGPMQNKPLIQQLNRQQSQPNQVQIGQPPVMMPHQQPQQIQMNQMQQRPPQQQQQQQSQQQMGMPFNSNYNEQQQWNSNPHQPSAMQSPQIDQTG
jgi:histone-lysine N-methyltransferase MLL3